MHRKFSYSLYLIIHYSYIDKNYVSVSWECTFPELRWRRRHSDQATGWTIPGSNPGSGNRFFSSPKPSRPAEAQPASY